MGGGLMQLIAYGAQDMYLTGNPQITFFKVVYRRHTNFSMEVNKGYIEGIFDHGCENDIINLGENFFRKSGLPFWTSCGWFGYWVYG